MTIPNHPLAILPQQSTPIFLLMDSMKGGGEEIGEEEEAGVEAERETETDTAGTERWTERGWVTVTGSIIRGSTAV